MLSIVEKKSFSVKGLRQILDSCETHHNSSMAAVVERTEEATLFSQGSTLSSSLDEQESDSSIGMIRATMSRESDKKSSEFDEKKEENESDDEDVFYESFDGDKPKGKQESGQSSHEEDDKAVQSLSSLPPPTNVNDVVSSDRRSKMYDFVKNPLHIIDTWDEITKRDKPLSNETLVHVMDHSMAMLGERLCEANCEFRDSLKAFEHKLGRFRNSEIELGKRIASGSFADIYRVSSFRDFGSVHPACTELQAKAAQIVKQDKPDEYVVKVLRKSLLLSKKFFATGAADFITEGTLLASFDHPHILSIRGRSATGVEGFSTGKRDCIFLVLERMNGDLTHKLQEWKRRSSQHGLFAKGRRNHNIGLLCERLELMSDLAGAMAYLHERNVIHRDVALGNVGISFSGKAKLLDFGLAKVLPPSHSENERFLLTGKTGSVR